MTSQSVQGACSTCSSSKVSCRAFFVPNLNILFFYIYMCVCVCVLHDLQLTLKGGVESMLLHYCPEVKSVEEVISSDIEEASQSQLKFVEEMTRSGGD